MHEWHKTREKFRRADLVLYKGFPAYETYVHFWKLDNGSFAIAEYVGKEAGSMKSEGMFLDDPDQVIVTLLNYGFKVDSGFLPETIEERPRYVIRGEK